VAHRFDSDYWNVPCGNCGKPIRVRVARLRRREKIRCPHCKMLNDPKGWAEAIKALEKFPKKFP